MNKRPLSKAQLEALAGIAHDEALNPGDGQIQAGYRYKKLTLRSLERRGLVTLKTEWATISNTELVARLTDAGHAFVQKNQNGETK